MEKQITRAKKIGLAPGALIHIGKKKIEEVRITLIEYDEKNFHEKRIENIEDCFKISESHKIKWINIDGLSNVGIIKRIGEEFGIHQLILEDILTTDQRPKIEDFGNYIYTVLRMLSYGDENRIKSEQVSLILGQNFLITFQESVGDVFNPVRERLKKEKSNIRNMGADYLFYSLIDVIVDNYFIILENIGGIIEELEDEIITNPSTNTLKKVYNLKREMLLLRKSVWPLREVVNGVERSTSNVIHKQTRIYLRDLYDHIIQIIDTIETFREMLSGMIDIYLSSISNKLNEVMKVLTIIATVFIPLTFIAGIYGMNFKYMPELEWEFGYPLVLIIMLSVAIIMISYFKKKKWI
ncbi:MAG: magnesium/cobalt transporter CorA [Candidatus Altiarchaeota archaeon]